MGDASQGDLGSDGSYLPCSPSVSSGNQGAPDQTGMKGSSGLSLPFSGRAGSACLQRRAVTASILPWSHSSSWDGKNDRLCTWGNQGETSGAPLDTVGATGQEASLQRQQKDFATGLSLTIPRDTQDLWQLLSFSPSPQHFTPGASTSRSTMSGTLCPPPLPASPHTAMPLTPRSLALTLLCKVQLLGRRQPIIPFYSKVTPAL